MERLHTFGRSLEVNLCFNHNAPPEALAYGFRPIADEPHIQRIQLMPDACCQ